MMDNYFALLYSGYHVLQPGKDLQFQAFLADESPLFGRSLDNFNDALPLFMLGGSSACLRAEATEHRQGGSRAAWEGKQTASAAESSMSQAACQYH